jgi:hypothetical protein
VAIGQNLALQTLDLGVLLGEVGILGARALA